MSLGQLIPGKWMEPHWNVVHHQMYPMKCTPWNRINAAFTCFYHEIVKFHGFLIGLSNHCIYSPTNQWLEKKKIDAFQGLNFHGDMRSLRWQKPSLSWLFPDTSWAFELPLTCRFTCLALMNEHHVTFVCCYISWLLVNFPTAILPFNSQFPHFRDP